MPNRRIPWTSGMTDRLGYHASVLSETDISFGQINLIAQLFEGGWKAAPREFAAVHRRLRRNES